MPNTTPQPRQPRRPSPLARIADALDGMRQDTHAIRCSVDVLAGALGELLALARGEASAHPSRRAAAARPRRTPATDPPEPTASLAPDPRVDPGFGAAAARSRRTLGRSEFLDPQEERA